MHDVRPPRSAGPWPPRSLFSPPELLPLTCTRLAGVLKLAELALGVLAHGRVAQQLIDKRLGALASREPLGRPVALGLDHGAHLEELWKFLDDSADMMLGIEVRPQLHGRQLGAKLGGDLGRGHVEPLCTRVLCVLFLLFLFDIRSNNMLLFKSDVCA
eukprot:Amastigsp_a339868_139.p5 type:complete len:158 gc:universal Amastigsp_a339868_139:823-350(-)